MALAYRVGSPIFAGGTVIVPGTDSVGFAVKNWPKLLVGDLPSTDYYKQAASLIKHHDVRRIMGHSFGASVAATLADKYRLIYSGYGRPGLRSRPGDHANLFDPVAFLLSKTSRHGGHSLSDYAT